MGLLLKQDPDLAERRHPPEPGFELTAALLAVQSTECFVPGGTGGNVLGQEVRDLVSQLPLPPRGDLNARLPFPKSVP